MSESLKQPTDVVSADMVSEKLDPQAAEYLRQTVAATDLGELPEGMKRDFNLPRAEQVAVARDEALARLDVDYALRKEEAKAEFSGMKQRSQAKKAEDEAAVRVEGNVAYKNAYEAALANQAADIEAKKAALTGDKIEKHHKAQQIELEAKQLAKKVADEAVANRKAAVASVGGGKAGVRRAQLQDKRAEEQAEKDAWKERMGVGGALKQQQKQSKSVRSAFKDDATAGNMSYKEWLAAGGEQGAKQRENTPAPALVPYEQAAGHETKLPFCAVSAEIDVPLKGEDAFINDPENGSFAVFDGMGGHAGGDVASRIAKETFEQILADADNGTDPETIRQQLVNGMKMVSENIYQRQNENHPVLHGMGTTAVVSKIVRSGDKAYLAWASVGDSRLYVQHGTEVPQQVSVDDGVGNQLSNVLHAWSGEVAPGNSGVVELHDGTRVMLCSDGITGDWEDEFITNSDMRQAFDLLTVQEAAEKMLELSKKRDDKTLVMIDIHQGTPEEGEKHVGELWDDLLRGDDDPWATEPVSVLPRIPFAAPVDGRRAPAVAGDTSRTPAGEIKLPVDIERKLHGARNAYVAAAAKSGRKQVGDYFNESTRIGRWLRQDTSGRRGQFLNLVNGFNKLSDKQAQEAYKQYLYAQTAAAREAGTLFEAAGISPEEQRALTLLAASAEAAKLELDFTNLKQRANGGKQSRIATFWVKRTLEGGLKGNAAKAAAVAIPSALLGFGAAVASAPVWLPTVAAFGAASGVSRIITRNEDSVNLRRRRDGSYATYGDDKAARAKYETDKKINQEFATGKQADVYTVAQDFESRRVQAIGERRRRARNIRKVAAAAMGVGNFLGNQLVDSPRVPKNTSDQNSGGRASTTPTSEVSPSTTRVPDAAPAESIPRPSIPDWSPEEWNNYQRMMEWRENAIAAKPGITDAELVDGWNKYLQGLNRAG